MIAPSDHQSAFAGPDRRMLPGRQVDQVFRGVAGAGRSQANEAVEQHGEGSAPLFVIGDKAYEGAVAAAA